MATASGRSVRSSPVRLSGWNHRPRCDVPAESAERLLEREREVTSLGDALEEARARLRSGRPRRGARRPGQDEPARRGGGDRGGRRLQGPPRPRQRAGARLRLRRGAAAARAGGRARVRAPSARASSAPPRRSRSRSSRRRAISRRRPRCRPTPPSRCCTVSTGCSTTSPTRGPSRSRSTTCTGPIRSRVRFLNHLAPRLDGLPVAVLGSMRSGEAVTADLARLAAAPETTLLRPGPLSVEATATLCERRLGRAVAPEFAAACRTATSGNPYFLEALLREAHQQRLATDARAAARVRDIAPAAVARAVLAAPRQKARGGDRPRPRRRGARRRREPRRGGPPGRARRGRGGPRRRPA